MSENWDDEKYTSFELSSFTLTVLRDFGVYFISMIEFDIFLGPVVTLTEVVSGSRFVEQLKNSRKLSEVYAGFARTNLNEFSSDDKSGNEKIAVSRISPEGDEDVVSVLIISMRDDQYMQEVKKLSEAIINFSGGYASELDKNIQNAVRQYAERSKTTFEKKDKSLTLIFDNENRPLKSLGLSFINGFFTIDLKNKFCDVSNLPLWIDEIKFDVKDLLNSIQNQLIDIKNEITTVFINGIPFMAKKGNSEVYTFLTLKHSSVGYVNSISKWFAIVTHSLSEEWRLADRREILAVLSFLDEAGIRGTIPASVESISNLLIQSMRITPITNYNVKELYDSGPYFLSTSRWDDLLNMNGSMTIEEISRMWMETILSTTLLLDWARSRKLIFLMTKE